MPIHEQLGTFYLGRGHDIATGEDSPEPLFYMSKDLTTHAVCVGMTGSGKTGLCLGLLEEAAIDGVPAIAIDPKGDLGNLLLAFPKLEPGDFRPWIDEQEAARKGKTLDEFAAATAQSWREGLASWDQGPDRIARYCDTVERVIFTPGSSAGIPLTVLKSFAAPPKEVVDDTEAMRERVQSAASGVLALLGINADPVQSREHILLSNLLDHAWRAGRDLSVAELIREIRKPPFQQVGVMDIETFYPASGRTELAMKLNNLLASPSFAGWMEGEPLSIPNLLHGPTGKPRLSIISIAHLNDAERMFLVTILLNELIAWMRSQPGTSSLRAILYMDEVFGYFPPIGEPPSKRPMLTLLKQARAYGVGCVLATQNPVDLDYKGLSNAGTWFLGRLQTERDKARVMEGLEGASAAAGSTFNKREMEKTLAGLASRVFVMNNVHEDHPQVFQTRWVLSYLRGPLTTGQIKTLMDPVRNQFLTNAPKQVESPQLPRESTGVDTPPATSVALSTSAASSRPVLPAKVAEKFLEVAEVLPAGSRLRYEPGLLARGRLHFVRASHDIDVWQEVYVLRAIHGDKSDEGWEGVYLFDQPPHLSPEPEEGAEFGQLPSHLAQEATYKKLQRDLVDYLYRTQVVKRWRSSLLNVYSDLGEEEQAFRQRLAPKAREARDRASDDLEARYRKRLAEADSKINRAQSTYNEQNSQFWGRVGGFLMNVVEVIMAVLSGGKSRRRASTSVTAARQAATERGQAQRAKQRLDDAMADKEELLAKIDRERQELAEQYLPDHLKLEAIEAKPRKSDVDVEWVSLAWLPGVVDDGGRRVPVY